MFQENNQEGNKPSFEMTIQDIFTLSNDKLVATGMIREGKISEGDAVRIRTENGDLNATVSKIEVFRKQLNTATAGENAALMLEGIEKDQLKIGYIIYK